MSSLKSFGFQTKWHVMVVVCHTRDIPNLHDRIHVSIDERIITIFRDKFNKLSAIDSVCHHAAGPLTMGTLQDIEDLDVTVVLCPHHKYAVSIHDGTKIYQAVEIKQGKPVAIGWKRGKTVQRNHNVFEDLISGEISLTLNQDNIHISSDQDSKSTLCAQYFPLHCKI